MATPLAMESKYLLGLLQDGEWHPFEEVITSLAAAIAPGKALRRYEEREQSRLLIAGERKTPELSDDEKIASGRRTLAGVTFNSLKKRYIEVEGEGDGRKVRRRPPSTWPRRLEEGATDEELDEEPDEEQADPVDDRNPFTCQRCGLWVVNVDQHEVFHQEQDQIAQGVTTEEPAAETVEPDAVAFDEDYLRQVIRSEMTAVLAGFEVRLTVDDHAALVQLVRNQIDSALDGFQVGMQAFFIRRLADQENAIASWIDAYLHQGRSTAVG